MSGSKESRGTEESKKCHNIILMFKKWLYKNICISVCLSDPSVWSLCADTFLFEKNVTSAGKNEAVQESDGGGHAGAPVSFQDQAVVVTRRPDPPSSTICPSSSSVHTISTPIANSTTSSSSAASIPAAVGSEKASPVLDQHTMLAIVRQKEEERRKAQEDFDSLFDDQHVF